MMQQVADMVQVEVGGGIAIQNPGFAGVVALFDQHGGHTLPQIFLNGREQSQLVVHHDVMLRRKEPLHVIQHGFLVEIDKHAAPKHLPQTRPLESCGGWKTASPSDKITGTPKRRCSTASTAPG